MERVRDLSELPKAHLHLHFTGSMRPTTVLELADKYGVRLPEALTDALTSGEPPRLRATDERGWFRFQRLYDAARSCLREPEDIQRLVREAAEEDLRDGSGWLEIQVDPTSYAPRLGGLIPALEVILDAVETTSRETGLRHAGAGRREPYEASAGRAHAGPAGGAVRGPGAWSASGSPTTSGGAWRGTSTGPSTSRGRAVLLSAPHGGELAGPASVPGLPGRPARHADRARGAGGRRPAAAEAAGRPGRDLRGVPGVERGARCTRSRRTSPLRTFFEAGVPMALGADDPLLFGSRLAAQYEIARQAHGFTDAEPRGAGPAVGARFGRSGGGQEAAAGRRGRLAGAPGGLGSGRTADGA